MHIVNAYNPIIHFHFPLGLDVTQGDIRLVGSTDQWEGRVEIFLSDEWGTVCSYRSYYAAWTVCRQLGYHVYGRT